MNYQNMLGVLVSVCTRRSGNRTLFSKNVFDRNYKSLAFFFFTKGKVRVLLNGSEFTAGRHDILVLEPGDEYAFVPWPGRALSYYNIGFAPVTQAGVILSRDELGLEPLVRFGRPGEMARYLRALLAAFKGKGRYRLQECSMLGLRVLLLLEPSRVSRDPPIPLHEPDNRPPADRILDIIDYINSHYKERLALKPLAVRAAMDPSRFSRAFRKVTGMPPHRYILEKKIARAKDSLLLHNESLTLAAEELGFHDYSHFCKVFQRMTGISPRQFLDKTRGRKTR